MDVIKPKEALLYTLADDIATPSIVDLYYGFRTHKTYRGVLLDTDKSSYEKNVCAILTSYNSDGNIDIAISNLIQTVRNQIPVSAMIPQHMLIRAFRPYFKMISKNSQVRLERCSR